MTDLEQQAREMWEVLWERIAEQQGIESTLQDESPMIQLIAQALQAVREADAQVIDVIIGRVSRGGNDMFVTALLAELKQAADAIREGVT